MLKVIDGAAESNQDGVAGGVSRSPIDEIARERALQMLEAAIRHDTRAGFVADRDARGLRGGSRRARASWRIATRAETI
jgi:hypothetical protein